MSYQKGDKILTVAGRDLRLRLRLGALAEMCDQLDAPSPTALAKCVCRPSRETIQIMVQALLRPVHGEGAQALSRTVAADRAAPLIADLFAEAFQ